MTRAATVVSYVLHPLWMPLFTLSLVYWIDPFLGLHPPVFRFLLFILVVNTVAPGLSVLFMVRRGVITDLEIRRKRERFIPFLLFLFYYGLSYALIRLRVEYVPTDVLVVFFALIVSLVVGMLFTLRTKISMHLMAIGGLCGSLAAFNEMHLLGRDYIIALVLIGAGLLGWARIRMGVHSHRQVYLGFLVGFLVHYGFLTFRLYL
jgi:hypothetical protein